LPRYSNFSIFKDAAVCHIGFLKLEFCQAHRAWEANVHQQTKFHRNLSNGLLRYRDFSDDQDGSHLGF